MILKTNSCTPVSNVAFKGCSIGKNSEDRINLAKTLVSKIKSKPAIDTFMRTSKETCDKIDKMGDDDLLISWKPKQGEYSTYLNIELHNTNNKGQSITSKGITVSDSYGTPKDDKLIKEILEAFAEVEKAASEYYTDKSTRENTLQDDEVGLKITELADFWA